MGARSGGGMNTFFGSKFQCWNNIYVNCMILVIDVNNGIKEPTQGYLDCNALEGLMFVGYFKVRETMYTQVISTILDHIDNKTI